MIVRSILAVCALAALQGCAALGGGGAQGFELRAPTQVRAARQTDLHLTVEVPETFGALEGDRVLLRPSGIEATYLPASEWTEDVPLMVQALLLRALQASDGYAFVGRRPVGLASDYTLLTELTDFQGDLRPATAEGAPTVVGHVGMQVTVLRDSDGRVVGSKRFEATRPAANAEAQAIAAALDAATRAVLPDVTSWVLRKTGAQVRG